MHSELISDEISLPLCMANDSRILCSILVAHRNFKLKMNTMTIETIGAINCTCGLIYRLGIPCRHFFCAFLSCADAVLVPTAVCHTRWLKSKHPIVAFIRASEDSLYYGGSKDKMIIQSIANSVVRPRSFVMPQSNVWHLPHNKIT